MAAGAKHPPFSQRHEVLYAASIERIEEAQILFDRGSWAMSIYLAGLAVEAILQAFAHRGGSPHTARHDLGRWLDLCPSRLVDLIKGNARDEWSLLSSVWDNTLRYLPEEGLVAHLKASDVGRRLKGGRKAMARTIACRFLDAARAVHNKGLQIWPAE
jgi:hypothetical protein